MLDTAIHSATFLASVTASHDEQLSCAAPIRIGYFGDEKSHEKWVDELRKALTNPELPFKAVIGQNPISVEKNQRIIDINVSESNIDDIIEDFDSIVLSAAQRAFDAL